MIVGTVIAMPTSDIPAGPLDMAYTCQAKATRNAPSPSSDAVAPIHSRRKSRSRSGVRMPLRLPAEPWPKPSRLS